VEGAKETLTAIPRPPGRRGRGSAPDPDCNFQSLRSVFCLCLPCGLVRCGRAVAERPATIVLLLAHGPGEIDTASWTRRRNTLLGASNTATLGAVAVSRCPATTVVADDPDDLKGTLKHIGGSQSDQWNNILFNQTVQTLWLKHSDKDTCDRHYRATVAALIGIGPKDEIEEMIAAQLLAAHNAAMECYRRA